MNRVVLAALAVSAIAFGGAACAQGIDFSKVEIKTIDLGRNTYRLEGQGGNITIAVGTDGIIMVDGQFAPLHDKIKAAIAAISPLCRSNIWSTLTFMAITPVATQAFKTRAPLSLRRTMSGCA